MATWSGTYTNEIVVSTPYQAKNGVKAIIDLDILGDSTIIAPLTPEDNSSFSVWIVNTTGKTLTITAPLIQNPKGGKIDVTSIVLKEKGGVIGFTFIDGSWHISEFTSFFPDGNYGGIGAEGNSTATTIASPSSDFSNKAQITVFDTNAAASQGTTPDHTNDHITIDVDGAYLVTVNVSFRGASNNTTYSFAAFKNNGATQLGARSTRKVGTGGDVGSASQHAIVSLVATDTVEVWIQNETQGSDVTIEDIILTVVRIG